MRAPLTAIQRAGGLSTGQVVTLLVGLTLSLAELHACGTLSGPLHPRDVEVDESGRPALRASTAPEHWTERDDLTALLRLGTALAAGDDALALALGTRAGCGELELVNLAGWLLAFATPEPLMVRR
jgi:hypothetical protein